jgi:MSHA biogenesis protein MshM
MATLESLRLLSNLETEKRKLIQIVLFGQPELDSLLSRPQIRQLMQRITFSDYLGTMGAESVPAYLEHRLVVAAQDEFTDVKVFEEDAARALAHFSGGVPRLVNVLAHKCLMLAYGEDEHRVQQRHVRLAALDTPGVRQPAAWWKRWRPVWRRADRGALPIAMEEVRSGK